MISSMIHSIQFGQTRLNNGMQLFEFFYSACDLTWDAALFKYH